MDRWMTVNGRFEWERRSYVYSEMRVVRLQQVIDRGKTKREEEVLSFHGLF